MYALFVYNAYMKSKHTIKAVQVTIRNVPQQVKKLLSDRAASDGKSLNTVLVEALSLAAGVSPWTANHTDLDELAGSWVDDPDFDNVIREQHQIDEEMWR
jgi:plasmid stability protein